MTTIPLFGLTSGGTLGLSGIREGLAIQAQQQELRQLVEQTALNSLDTQSELDRLDQFARFRSAGLSANEAQLLSAQTSINANTASAALDDYTKRVQRFAPIAIEAANNGNPGLFNSVFSGTGVRFDPNNPTSGFSGFGPSGSQVQAQARISNNASGGLLFNQPQAPVAPPQPTPAQQAIDAVQNIGGRLGAAPAQTVVAPPQQAASTQPPVVVQAAPLPPQAQLNNPQQAVIPNQATPQAVVNSAPVAVTQNPVTQQAANVQQAQPNLQLANGNSFTATDPGTAQLLNQFQAFRTFQAQQAGQAPAAPVQSAAPQPTQIQQNAQLIASQLNQTVQNQTAARARLFDQPVRAPDTRAPVTNPQSQRLEAVTFPTVTNNARRQRLSDGFGFTSLYAI